MSLRIPIGVLSSVALPVTVSRLYQWRNRNWGSSPAERDLPMPGDDLLPVSSPPTTMATRSTT